MDFYERIAGWAWDDLPIQGIQDRYFMALRDGRPVGGCMRMDWVSAMPDVPAQWCSYLAVEDVDDAVRQSVGQGAIILRASIELRDIGRIALIRDPVGAIAGLITPSRA